MIKIRAFISRIIKDRFIKTSLFFFIATMVSNVFNYLFQITMGRMLSVEKYGEMNSLFSIIMLLTILLTPVSNFFARDTAKLYALDKKKRYEDYLNMPIPNLV